MALNLDGDIHARRQVELLQFVHRFGGRLDDIDEPFVGALFERFLRLLVRVRRPLDGEPFDAGWQRDGTGDTGAGALDGVGDVAGGLVDDAMVKGLQSDANALSSHRKNNCLLMVSLTSASRFRKAEAKYSNQSRRRNRFLKNFSRTTHIKIQAHVSTTEWRQAIAHGVSRGK